MSTDFESNPLSPSMQLLGVPVIAVTTEVALSLVNAQIVAHRPHVVAFANANLLNMASADPSLRGLLRQCLVFNDGAGANLGARLLHGRGFPDNLNGTDLTPALLAALPAGRRVFLLGARAEVLAQAAQVFARRWPHLVLAGTHDGFFSSEAQAALVAEVVSTRPDVVLVAMGNGRQERVALALRDAGVPSSWAVGALFDFWAQVHPRAPGWMRAAGLEWLFRLLREPARLWRRYLLGNPLFVARVLRERLTRLKADTR